MGIYESLAVYHGRLLSKSSYQRVKTIVPKSFICDGFEGYVVLHAPGRMIRVGGDIFPSTNLDYRITKNRVEEYLQKDPEKWDSWNLCTDEDLQTLQNYVKIASGGKEEEKPHFYILFIETSTLTESGALPKGNIRVEES